MKISTDAVLLGALATTENPDTILDIGTGTGVIALMLAQRFPDAKVTAIEIDEDAAGQAEENFQESQYSARLELSQGRIQDFSTQEKYPLIVSNPPFFPDHLKSQDSKRNKALHTDDLSFEELIAKVSELLTENGSFWLILPPSQMKTVEVIAEKSGLFLHHKIKVRDTDSKPVHREICEFGSEKMILKINELVLKDQDLNYTASYSALLSGFLLGFGGS